MEYFHNTGFIDIETSGLPVKMVPGAKPGTMKKQQLDYETEFMDFPFIVAISWAVNDGEPQEFVLNPEGRIIPKEASDIHGITTEVAQKSDKKFVDVLPVMMRDLRETKVVVGHGLYFDTSIIKANVQKGVHGGKITVDHRIGIDDILHKYKRVDTMRSAAKMCRKWPTLSELHQKIFRQGFDCHSAAEDVRAVRRCYEWMLIKGIVPTWEELQEKAEKKEQMA